MKFLTVLMMLLYLAVCLVILGCTSVAAITGATCGGSSGRLKEEACSGITCTYGTQRYQTCSGWWSTRCTSLYKFVCHRRRTYYCMDSHQLQGRICVLKCIWTPWSPWGPCSETCDWGVQTRTRITFSPLGCVGNNDNSQVCSIRLCDLFPTGTLEEGHQEARTSPTSTNE